MGQFEMIKTYCRTWLLGDDLDAEAGAGLIEYALLVSLIALVCFAAVNLLGGTTDSIISSAATGLDQ